MHVGPYPLVSYAVLPVRGVPKDVVGGWAGGQRAGGGRAGGGRVGGWVGREGGLPMQVPACMHACVRATVRSSKRASLWFKVLRLSPMFPPGNPRIRLATHVLMLKAV
jgi:hypothetical protein